MTWFGIVLLVLWVLDAGFRLAYAALGESFVTSPGWLLFGALITTPLLVLGLLFVGTGHI